MSDISQETRATTYKALLAALTPGAIGEMYEVLTADLYARWLSAGQTAFDCGANVGRHTVTMARAVAPGGRVHAFEPSTAVLPHLKQRIAQSGVADVVTLHEVALGQRAGQATFSVVHNATGMSGLQLRGDLDKALNAPPRVEQITVPVTTLDVLFPPSTPVRFIKLDLEGGEYHAMLGGRNLIDRARPMLVFENGRGNSAKDYGYTAEEFFRLFDDLDYAVYDALGFPFGSPQWTLGSVPWQFIAIPKGHREMSDVMTTAIPAMLNAHGLGQLISGIV